jgi:hypothetical protein
MEGDRGKRSTLGRSRRRSTSIKQNKAKGDNTKRAKKAGVRGNTKREGGMNRYGWEWM